MLLAIDESATTMTFDEVAELVGPLPQSAWRHQAWWANEAAGNHVQARSWLSAGFRVDGIDQHNGWVRFQRDRGDGGVAGVREPRTPRPDSSFDEIRVDLPDDN
jgi:hypothetical protein